MSEHQYSWISLPLSELLVMALQQKDLWINLQNPLQRMWTKLLTLVLHVVPLQFRILAGIVRMADTEATGTYFYLFLSVN